MTRAVRVPITPSVLRWAIKESGYSASNIAEEMGVGASALEAWKSGKEVPTLTEARQLASKLRRPLAALLLPKPPASQSPAVEFRRAHGARRKLRPNERFYLRQAGRLQVLLSWLQHEVDAPPPVVGHFSVDDIAESAAQETRETLGVSIEDQVGAPSASAAWRLWRRATEDNGIFVVAWSMGPDSCRGFSVWDHRAPLIAVNTSLTPEARTFTLAHEFGHLITRTNSACLETSPRVRSADNVERWCESFAAALLVPHNAAVQFANERLSEGQKAGLSVAAAFASRFKISLRAAVLRLIELGRADWGLYKSIPPASDRPAGHGGGAGRSRAQIRLDQYGSRTVDLFGAAVGRDVISRADMIDYLDVPPEVGAAAHG